MKNNDKCLTLLEEIFTKTVIPLRRELAEMTLKYENMCVFDIEETPKTSAKDKRIIGDIQRIIDELNDGKQTSAFQSLIIHEAKQQERIGGVKTTTLLRDFNGDKWKFKIKTNKGGKKEKCYKRT